jgi:dynein heavy chain
MAEIEETRNGYVPIAYSVSQLFFAITDLANCDPMYQYSLEWYRNLYVRGIHASQKSSDISERLANLRSFFMKSLYQNVCRSLFEKDKLTFSFLLTIKVMESKNEMDSAQLLHLLTGGVIAADEPKPDVDWLQMRTWVEIQRLDKLEGFFGIKDAFLNELDDWKGIYDSVSPQNEEFPSSFQSGGPKTDFHRLILLRAIRADKVVPAIKTFVENRIGHDFVDPPLFDLELCYSDSSVSAPLIFVLSPGSDPTGDLYRFADKSGQTIAACSLGQGQGPIAENLIDQAISAGSWVLLQNCHLATSWMPSLEKVVESIVPDETPDTFRMWCTSYPSPSFPIALLQNGVKMTNEPPAGLRANVMRSFKSEPLNDSSFYNAINVEEHGEKKFLAWRKLSVSLCMFHATVQERKNFGSLGWNVPYAFDASDLDISMRQLQLFIIQQDETPWGQLKYCAAECNYGGRVVDDHDRVCINTILAGFYCDAALVDGHRLSESDDWFLQTGAPSYDDTFTFLQALPRKQTPSAFGLHANADIAKDQQSTFAMFDTALTAKTGASSSGDGEDTDAVLASLSKDFLSKLPDEFEPVKMAKKYPIDYHECMNTVLVQEAQRYNGLTEIVRTTLINIEKATRGLVVMSSQLEAVAKSLILGKVPALWKSRSYPSLKPLASYFKDLVRRIKFLTDWYDNGKPVCFWFSGIFFSHSFTTAAKQNYARKYKIAIDGVSMGCKVQTDKHPTEQPEDGVYIYGQYIDGARWDRENLTLADALPKMLFDQMVVMWLQPMKIEDISMEGCYPCPCYIESNRRGILTTSGHSSNFIMDFAIPTKDKTASFWVKRGVALLLQLDD